MLQHADLQDNVERFARRACIAACPVTLAHQHAQNIAMQLQLLGRSSDQLGLPYPSWQYPTLAGRGWTYLPWCVIAGAWQLAALARARVRAELLCALAGGLAPGPGWHRAAGVP